MSLRRPARPALIPLLLAAGAVLLALLQRPGTLLSDSRAALAVDPGGHLGDASSAWTATGALGEVWGGPAALEMLPASLVLAIGDGLGIPGWIVQRLWIGALLALAAWGTVRLLDRMLPGPRGPEHAVAGALVVLSPVVAAAVTGTSIVLVAYAALPWLLLVVHDGLREPQAWGRPLAAALLLGLAAGGTLAALGWVAAGAALLVLLAVASGAVGAAAAAAFSWRLALLGVLLCAWWVVPLVVGLAAGTETLGPAAIDLRDVRGEGPVLLRSDVLVVAGLALLAAAVLSWAWTWRTRATTLAAALVGLGLAGVLAGFPDAAPRGGLAAAGLDDGDVLRTSGEAALLVGLGVAILLGVAAGRLVRAVDEARGPRLALAAGAPVLVLAVLAAWPLASGRAPDAGLGIDVPGFWEDASDDVDAVGGDARALLVPGQVVASRDFGEAVEPVLGALSETPVAQRSARAEGDPRAAALLWAVDDLVTRGTLLPGQLAPLLDVLGAGRLVVARDGVPRRSGETPSGEVARTLGGQPAAGAARARALGPPVLLRDDPGRIDGARTAPAIEIRPAATDGLVRVLPRGPLTVVDGGAQGLVELAAFGDLDPAAPHVYAPDLARDGITEAARTGAAFVIADGAHRRLLAHDRLRANRGPVVAAGEDVDDTALPLPFSTDLDGAGGLDRPETQTVAVLRGKGVRAVRAPVDPHAAQSPEHRATAALDGDLATMWLAEPTLASDEHRFDVELSRSRDVDVIALHPASDSRGVVRAVEVNGVRHEVRRGWNRLEVDLEDVDRLRVRIAEVDRPEGRRAGAGGIRELRIPGVRVREVLRPPVVLERALREEDITTSPLTYLLSRVTAEAPRTRARLRGEPQARDPRDARDPEERLSRIIRPPAARSFTLEAWVSLDPRASDRTIDRAVSPAAAGLAARSSSRYRNLPRHRASGAFDGGLDRAWIGEWIPGRPAWISWRTPGTTTLERLRIVPPAVSVRRPTKVRLRSERSTSDVVAVRDDGFVRLPEPLRGRSFRLDVVEAELAPEAPPAARPRRAVGIGELRGAGVDPVAARRSGRVSVPCGAAEIEAGRERAELRIPAQDVRRLDAGRPVRAEGCGPLDLPSVRLELSDTGRGAWRIDHLRLASTPPAGLAVPGLGGSVLDTGTRGRGERTGVRVEVAGPAWLVHGEAFDPGWRASCDGRDLGEPLPVQGYATGWPVEEGCEEVEISFAPNGAVTAGRVATVAALVVLLSLLLLLRRQRRLADREAGVGRVLGAIGGATLSGETPSHLRPRPDRDVGPAAGRWARRGALVAGAALLVAAPALHLLRDEIDAAGAGPISVLDVPAHWAVLAALAVLVVGVVGATLADRRPPTPR